MFGQRSSGGRVERVHAIRAPLGPKVRLHARAGTGAAPSGSWTPVAPRPFGPAASPEAVRPGAGGARGGGRPGTRSSPTRFQTSRHSRKLSSDSVMMIEGCSFGVAYSSIGRPSVGWDVASMCVGHPSAPSRPLRDGGGRGPAKHLAKVSVTFESLLTRRMWCRTHMTSGMAVEARRSPGEGVANTVRERRPAASAVGNAPGPPVIRDPTNHTRDIRELRAEGRSTELLRSLQHP